MRNACAACWGQQVLRRWEYGVMSDVTSVLYLQAPADMKGGNFRVWDPNVHDWGLRNATVQPAPTERVIIKVCRAPAASQGSVWPPLRAWLVFAQTASCDLRNVQQSLAHQGAASHRGDFHELPHMLGVTSV